MTLRYICQSHPNKGANDGESSGANRPYAHGGCVYPQIAESSVEHRETDEGKKQAVDTRDGENGADVRGLSFQPAQIQRSVRPENKNGLEGYVEPREKEPREEDGSDSLVGQQHPGRY